MKTTTVDELHAMPYNVFGFDMQYGQVVAHAAITQYVAGDAMFGCLVTDPRKWGEGYATAVSEHVLQTAKLVLPEMVTCKAYANDKGVEFFEKLGGVLIGSRGEDPYDTGCVNVIDLTPALSSGDAS